MTTPSKRPPALTLPITPRTSRPSAPPPQMKPSSRPAGTAFERGPGMSMGAFMCGLIVVCCLGVAVVACLSSVPGTSTVNSDSKQSDQQAAAAAQPASAYQAMLSVQAVNSTHPQAEQTAADTPPGHVRRLSLLFGGLFSSSSSSNGDTSAKPKSLFSFRSHAKAKAASTTTTSTTSKPTTHPAPVTSKAKPKTGPQPWCWEPNTLHTGNSIASVTVQTPGECQVRCQQTPACRYFTFRGVWRECALQREDSTQNLIYYPVDPSIQAVSGPKFCP